MSSASTTLVADLSGRRMWNWNPMRLTNSVKMHCESLPCLPTTVSISTALSRSAWSRAQKSVHRLPSSTSRGMLEDLADFDFDLGL